MRTKSEILRERVQAMREKRARDALKSAFEEAPIGPVGEMVRLPAKFWKPMYELTDKYRSQVQIVWDGKAHD